MQQNSFQKNGLLNINNNSSSSYNTFNYGRRSVQDIRDDMYKAKTKNIFNNTNDQVNNKQRDEQPDYRKRVEEMRNFYRWK